MSEILSKYKYETAIKLNNFEKYVRRQAISRFLARYELFKMVQDVKGSIIECGVHYGGGLMAWAKLSAALEPYALERRVIGFDTFKGFADVAKKDNPVSSVKNLELKRGGFSTKADVYGELVECVKEFDDTRYLNQFPKVELVKGDALKTIPLYLKRNPHLVISLLFLDFDLYGPTKAALKTFLPRMPKGGIIAFDEINNENWPGETIALVEKFSGLNKIALKKFPFDPNIAYAVLS